MTFLPPPLFDLDAALFDLDGTLVRTFIDFPALLNAVRDLAQTYDAGEVTEGETDILEVVARGTAFLHNREAGADDRFAQAAFAVIEAREAAGCAQPEAVDGATELLQTLRARGVLVAVITRNCRRVAEELMARMELPADLLLAREDTTEFKPHPAPVLRACERLGVRPLRASMTGDLWADIAAGRAAGVATTIGIQWAHDPPDRFARCAPDYVVGSLQEVARLIVPGWNGLPE